MPIYKVLVEQKREYSGFVVVEAPSPGHANEVVDDMLGGSTIEGIVWDKEPKNREPVRFESNHPELVPFAYTNKYRHCSSDWEDTECDSMHNDKCPECNAEIEPYESVENATGEVIKHVEESMARNEAIVALAKDQYGGDDIEFDENPEISDGDDNGAFVQAWVWANFEDSFELNKEFSPDDEPGMRFCLGECACEECGDTFFKDEKAWAVVDKDDSVKWYCDEHKPKEE